MTKINLLNFTTAELESYFLQGGEQKFRGAQLIKWLHQLGVTDFKLMTNFSLALREYLTLHCEIRLPQVVQELVAADGVRKWLVQLEDGALIETVFIPEDARGTLCISSQVGCGLGCRFCATGKLGFARNLTTAEIIGQLWLAVRRLSPDQTSRHHTITNVVFMGMGEPLLNFAEVLKASQLMLADHAYGLSKYRVTLSTCGIIPGLIQLKNRSDLALAISLHAPNEQLRSYLLPINKKYPLAELIKVSDNYFADTKRQVTIEYIMLAGVNDKLEHAEQLVKLLSHGRYKVNLIPANIIPGLEFKPSSQVVIDDFRKILLGAGINTITRKSRGQDIAAACGQLAAGRG